MKNPRLFLTGCAALLAASVSAAGPEVRPQFEGLLPALPGQHLRVVTVNYPPGATSPPHHHQGFVYAYVLSGSIRSQVEGEPARVYRAGENWTEAPGSQHLVSENASAKQPASLLAVLIGDP